MKILITTGLGKNDIGGPFQYAHNLEREFKEAHHKVRLISYGVVEKSLPIGFRHIYFFFRILPSVIWSEGVLILDTFSVGVPSTWASKLIGRKSIIRVGGDYLWSAYVNRTTQGVTLPDFYKNIPLLNFKEKIIFSLTKALINKTDYFAFNTLWQKKIWDSFYGIKDGKSGVVRNFIPPRREESPYSIKNIVWAGRVIPEKNVVTLRKIGQKLEEKYPDFRLDIVTGESHDQVLEKIRTSYAVTSIAYTDISPNFVIEGISFNKPFVLTKETGLNEIFPKGGILVDPLDEGEIEKAFESMLVDENYRKYVNELKENKLTHSWKELANDFLEIWKKI